MMIPSHINHFTQKLLLLLLIIIMMIMIEIR